MTDQDARRYAEWTPFGIAAFGMALFAVDLGAALYYVGVEGLLTPIGLVGRTITAASCAGIAFGGFWVHRSDLGATRYLRVGGWVLSFTVAFLAVNLLLVALIPAPTFYGNLAWAVFAAYSGGAGGVVVGVVEARTIGRAVEAEREAVRAEHVERQRQWLDYLNSLLRHEVLNNASIIQGYASLLLEEEDLPSPAAAYVETIHRQSEDMTDVIGDVRLLVRAADQIEYKRPVDVAGVLADELGDVRASYPEVEADLSVDGEAYVQADDLLPRIFSNLLSNAVEHNPSAVPAVSVTVSTTADVVGVAVADDGPGVPEDERGTLFERGQEDHGLGLYLVRVLADRYEGSVELAETGPGGSVFAVELPRADTPTDVDPDPANLDGAAPARPTVD